MKEKKIKIKLNNSQRQEELYESIIEDIRKKYDYKLSDVEAHEAARNLIEFVKILLEVHEKSHSD